jgi:hypothetical protein
MEALLCITSCSSGDARESLRTWSELRLVSTKARVRNSSDVEATPKCIVDDWPTAYTRLKGKSSDIISTPHYLDDIRERAQVILSAVGREKRLKPVGLGSSRHVRRAPSWGAVVQTLHIKL